MADSEPAPSIVDTSASIEQAGMSPETGVVATEAAVTVLDTTAEGEQVSVMSPNGAKSLGGTGIRRGSWEMITDPDNGVYYYCYRTQESSWVPPAVFADVAQEVPGPPLEASTPDPNGFDASSQQVGELLPGDRTDANELPFGAKSRRRGPWEEILDSTVGRVYYFNHDTQESTWEAPKEFQKGFFFTQAARKLLVVSVLSTVATNTLSAMRELSASPLLSTMGIVETCEPIVDPVTAVAVDDQPVNDAPCVEAVESQPIFSVDGATGLYAVDHLIVFADPDSGCPYYFDTLTGQSTWEEPPEVAAFKASNPHLFPEGFDENALCDTAMFEAEAEVAQLDADPTRHADFIASVGNWFIFNDPESQCCYYWHKDEGYTTWDAPDDISQLWDAHAARPTSSSAATLLQKPSLTAGLERSSKLPPIRLGKLPVAQKHVDVGAGLGKLLDAEGAEKVKRKKKRSKDSGKRTSKAGKEPSTLSPVAVHAHSHPGEAADCPAVDALGSAGTKSPRPDATVHVVTPPKPSNSSVDVEGGSESENECSPESPPPQSVVPCPPLQPPPAHVPNVIMFSGPKIGVHKPSSPPLAAKSALSSMPGRSIGAHATSPTHGSTVNAKSYNFTNNVLSSVTGSPTRVPIVVPAGARVVAAPRPSQISGSPAGAVRRKSAFGAPVPTGPIMPGPPPRLSSTTLGADVSPSAASEPTPMSSQFVRQHLMQASAMQSIAAANDTLYPAMPDVPRRRSVALEPLGSGSPLQGRALPELKSISGKPSSPTQLPGPTSLPNVASRPLFQPMGEKPALMPPVDAGRLQRLGQVKPLGSSL